MEISEILGIIATILTILLAAVNGFIHKRLAKVEQFVKTDLESQ